MSSFSNILFNYFIIGKILKLFEKVSEKFDLVRNWSVVGELLIVIDFVSGYNI